MNRILLIVLGIVVVLLLATGYRHYWHKAVHIKLLRKQKVYPIYVVLVVLVVAGLGLLVWPGGAQKESKKTSKPTAKVQTLPAQKLENPIAAPVGISGYELVGQRRTANALKITVYATDTDLVKITKLNDALLDHYKDSYKIGNKEATGKDVAYEAQSSIPKPSSLRIEYYSNKKAAQLASTTINVSALPADKRGEIIQYFTAFLMSSKTLGTSLLSVRPTAGIVKAYTL